VKRSELRRDLGFDDITLDWDLLYAASKEVRSYVQALEDRLLNPRPTIDQRIAAINWLQYPEATASGWHAMLLNYALVFSTLDELLTKAEALIKENNI
jgi:hypothetical protein